MELRPYQQEARESVQKEWDEGRKKTLLVLPTGCGKTIVFSKVIEDRVKLGERVLVYKCYYKNAHFREFKNVQN